MQDVSKLAVHTLRGDITQLDKQKWRYLTNFSYVSPTSQHLLIMMDQGV